MVEFFNWLLPLEFSGILKEAKACRSNCLMFDISHMGQIIVRGDNSEAFLQELTANDVSSIKPKGLQYNLFINSQGNIIDDFVLYRLRNGFLCIVNACNKYKVLDWLNKNKFKDLEIVDETENNAFISLQGPNSQSLLENILGVVLNDLGYMNFLDLDLGGVKLTISRSGYTGEDGFEIICPRYYASNLWGKIKEGKGKVIPDLGGLGARDILRIEAGYPLYGNDIDETTNPIEASLKWVVKYESKDFLGKEKILEIIRKGIERRRVGFIMEDRGVARKDYLIYSTRGSLIGKVTSGTYSPNLDRFIGMGYVDINFSYENTPILVDIRGKSFRAFVRRYPFIKVRVKS
ncbi:MAG: glycine cleavage system aminomethyltransferase GcvT [Candidatus Omnitrophica bacterium]|nr:glycine cleavage system aminomethyltransferase GcvT [Candidatus Omnitrophota bacterium]